MKPDFRSLLKSKQFIGVIVAAVVLSVIFIPLQRANAISLNLSMSNVVGGGIALVSQEDPETGAFCLTLNLAPSELFHANHITLSIDNSTLSEVFSATGLNLTGDNIISKFSILNHLFGGSGYGNCYGSGYGNGYGSGYGNGYGS